MAAYLIAHRREITDPETLRAYARGIDATIRRFGGRVVVRADSFETLEGSWHPGLPDSDKLPERMTVIEFPSAAALRDWYDSADYAELKAVRQRSSSSDIVAVDGDAAASRGNGRSWTRGLAAFAAGAATMLLAGRAAPPVAGRVAGTIRGALGGDPFDALARDHRAVLGLLRTIEKTDPKSRTTRAAMLFQVKRMLAAHALAEEDVVYPLLINDAQRQEESSRLYREHADMKVRLFELEHLAKDDPQWTGKLIELRQIVEAHARTEEETEFPALRQALKADQSARLFGDIQREKSLIL
jgi:uncharacterized protein (DUF1330 family)/hemerythrin superfamily protein